MKQQARRNSHRTSARKDMLYLGVCLLFFILSSIV